MAGRKKTPTKLKVLQGTFRKDRANENEPMPEIKIPNPPDHLSDVALKEWKDISEYLYGLGLLSGIDRSMLAMYCQAYSRWVKYENVVAEKGELIKTANGNVILSPAMWVVNKAMDQCHKYLTEFGCSPASRAKVTAIKSKEKEDPWEEFGN